MQRSLATRQRRLEQIGGADRALGAARPDDGMQLVDEEDHVGVLAHLFEDLLDALLELAAEHGARDGAAHAQRDDARVAQGRRRVALDDLAGNALDDGRLADAWLADQHWIVLLAATQHRQHAPDLPLATGGGVELALARLSREIAAKLVEGGRLAIFIGGALGGRGAAIAG